MPDDLDDYEIRHEPDFSRPRRGPSLLPLLLVLPILLLAGLGAYWLLTRPKPGPSAPTPLASESAAPVPRATPNGLPALQDSDTYVRTLAAALSAHPQLARWLSRTSLVRTLTVVVASIAAGETPRHDLEFLAPTDRFHAARVKGRVPSGKATVDPASYSGYDTFGDVVASIDAGAAASAYHTAEPLFDEAFHELGSSGPFRNALDTAIRELLAVPVLPADAPLIASPKGGWGWADPKVEALTAAQKQFLRIGPRNVRLIQGKLRELQPALAAP
jgi:hypothetical protein